MMQTARVVTIAAELQLRQMIVQPFIVFNALLAPFFYAVTALYMLRGRPDFDPVFVVLGAGLTGTWSVVLFGGSQAIMQERWQGTLELLEGSPTPLLTVLAGKMLGTLLFSLLAMVLSYGVAAGLFGYAITVHDLAPFGISLLLAAVSFWAIGLLFSPLAILWPVVQRYLNGIEYPVYIFGGFLSPVFLLPSWIVPVSYAVPPFWAALALHGTSSGGLSGAPLLATWTILCASAALLTLLSAALFRVMLRRARRDGTLAFS